MKHSANLEGLYKAAGRFGDAASEAAWHVARRSGDLGESLSKDKFAGDDFRMNREVMDAILERYMHPSIRPQFEADLQRMLAEEEAARREGKEVEHSIMYRDSFSRDNPYKLDEKSLGRVLNHTLRKPLDSDPDGDIAENLNGKYYYRAHLDDGSKPRKGSLGDIPFMDKLKETNYTPILPGLGTAALAGTLAGVDEGAVAGISTGLGGVLGSLAGSYFADSLGLGLPTYMSYGNALGGLFGSGLGYAGYNLLSALASAARKKKDKENKKKD